MPVSKPRQLKEINQGWNTQSDGCDNFLSGKFWLCFSGLLALNYAGSELNLNFKSLDV